MRTFLVSYDLASSANRHRVAKAVMQLGQAWARPLDNVWYLRAEETSSEIEARLSRHLSNDDGLLVQEARGDAALLNTSLRWFRARTREADPALAPSNVVPFPPPAAPGADPGFIEDDVPLLKAAS